MNKRLQVIIKDPNKKSPFLILKEVLIYMYIKRETPYYYFGKFLYRKKVSNFKDYLSWKETNLIAFSKKFNCYPYTSLLKNKLAFSLYCSENNLPTPKLVSYNFGSSFFNMGQLSKIDTYKELIAFFDTVLMKSKKTALFLKPVGASGGLGCILLKKETLSSQIEQHFKELISQDYIHQELIIQHSEINKINPNCINTLRFDTYIDNANKYHITSIFMRFGIGKSIVDNSSSGGFYVKVELNDGRLNQTGVQLMKYGGKEFTMQPDTKFIFGGFKIPFFNEACELVLKAVDYIPDKVIGWDIAITETGPILVEGNNNNSIFVSDIAYGGLLKKPIFKEILFEAKNV
jgi:hypothetical protein